MRPPSYLVALLLLSLPSSGLAQTDPQTASLGKLLLRQEAEPPPRLQAAKALGESDDPEAVGPLCTALQDGNAQVRAGAAEALEKLAEPGGLECLEARKDEPDAAARAAMQSAIRSLHALKARPPRVYVMLDPVKDATGKVSPELVKATEARMRRKLLQAGAWLAPEKEPEAAAKAVLKKNKLQGYRLMTEIRSEAPGELGLIVVCLRYPGTGLQGQAKVNASGGEPEELLPALAPEAIKEVSGSFKWK